MVERLGSVLANEIGSENEERERLAAAIEHAKAELAALAAQTDDSLAGEVLGFQLALLEDPELIAPGEPALKQGRGAVAAWTDGIGALIEDYDSADDEYFRARSADLRDLKRRVLRALSSDQAQASVDPRTAEGETHAILVVDELTPSRFLELDLTRVRGIASGVGSPTSHVAMLARARGIPLIVGLSVKVETAPFHSALPVILDADDGRLIIAPDEAAVAAARAAVAETDERERAAEALAAQPAVTADGTPITVLVNAESAEGLKGFAPAIADGIGLTRTEFLFAGGPPDEETQLAAYCAVLNWAEGRPVAIRTLDAGGDKPVPGVTPEGESNPFLGLRGLRLSLAKPQAFRLQLRALLRAAAEGPVKIMLPMVTRPYELARAREILSEVRDELVQERIPFADAPLGIMVETPAAALEPDAFDADFYSIGTNDLVQYVMAAARDIAAVAHLQETCAEPVLELVERVATAGTQRGVEASVCGEAASLPSVIPALLDRGIRVLSVPPAAVGRTKAAVAAHTLAKR